MRSLSFHLFLLLALLFAGLPAHAEDYSNLVERGEFFLAKGASYMPDAVRALEEAGEADPQRAAADARFVAAIAKAYLGVSRLTEAYHWILKLDRSGVKDKKVEGLKDHLLNEAGVGRLHLTARLPAFGVTGALKPEAETKLDGAGKKVLEKLNSFLQKPFSVGKEGLTLLVPEGKLTFSSNVPVGADGVYAKSFEIYAGDEVEQHLVAPFPTREGWKMVPGNRSVDLSWPSAEKVGSYRLTRAVGDRPAATLYEGADNAFSDKNAPPGIAATYTLLTFGGDGLLWGLSRIEATAKPPASAVSAKAHLNSELQVMLDWEIGDGSLDRLVIKKTERGEERTIVDQRGEEIVKSGEITDGPVTPAPVPQQVVYSVIAMVEGVEQNAQAKAVVLVPALASRIDSVKEQFTPDRVYVEWETFPRDAVAEGYHIYLLREPQGMGELMGTVKDAAAREFNYVPRTVEQANAKWKHLVIPYLGNRFLVDLASIEAYDKAPDGEMSRRLKRMRKIPNMILSWEPLTHATRYIVKVSGKKEFFVRENYVELTGLQANFTDAPGDVKVFALLSDGSLALVLTANIDYKRYNIEGTSGAEQ